MFIHILKFIFKNQTAISIVGSMVCMCLNTFLNVICLIVHIFYLNKQIGKSDGTGHGGTCQVKLPMIQSNIVSKSLQTRPGWSRPN